jgi:prepilin peptidase CpaA
MNILGHTGWLQTQGNLLIPFLLSVVMAVGDVRTRRIPNYLTLATALAGLLVQTLVSGWSGLLQGFGGLAMGFSLMLILYILGGMGAGDVKALAALGAWLTPWTSLSVFCYMAMAGAIIALGMLIWQGALWQFLRQTWFGLVNLVLTGTFFQGEPSTQASAATMPYGVAIAVGMAALAVFGPVI